MKDPNTSLNCLTGNKETSAVRNSKTSSLDYSIHPDYEESGGDDKMIKSLTKHVIYCKVLQNRSSVLQNHNLIISSRIDASFALSKSFTLPRCRTIQKTKTDSFNASVGIEETILKTSFRDLSKDTRKLPNRPTVDLTDFAHESWITDLIANLLQPYSPKIQPPVGAHYLTTPQLAYFPPSPSWAHP